MKKLLGLSLLLLMVSCVSTKSLNPNKVLQAGSAAGSALTISDAQVVQLCKEYMVKSDKENTVLPADNAYSKRLANIMSKFKNISNMNVNYAVYQSKTINAFASGDGSVRVYTGLMDVMDDEELFAVIGHELGHVKNKDTRDAYRNAYLMVAARYGISAINPTAGAISEGMIGDIAQQLASNAFSRRQEYAADDAALQFCLTNNVNPYAMHNALNVLLQLEKQSGGSGNSSMVKQMLSTHPDTAKRAARSKSNADATGKGSPNTQIKTNVNTVTPSGTNSGSTTVKPSTPSNKPKTVNVGGNKPKTIKPN